MLHGGRWHSPSPRRPSLPDMEPAVPASAPAAVEEPELYGEPEGPSVRNCVLNRCLAERSQAIQLVPAASEVSGTPLDTRRY